MIIGAVIGVLMIVGLWKGIQLIDEERDRIKAKGEKPKLGCVVMGAAREAVSLVNLVTFMALAGIAFMFLYVLATTMR